MSEDQVNKSICEERLYERLFKTHAETIRNFLYSKFGGMDLAEDLLQEAFVKLWENCAKVSPENAKSYVYKVAINLGSQNTEYYEVTKGLNPGDKVITSSYDSFGDIEELILK